MAVLILHPQPAAAEETSAAQRCTRCWVRLIAVLPVCRALSREDTTH
jgi:hypothetical protein